MTLQELSQYFKLRERLERDEEMLESLQAAACPGAQILTGMPHTPGIKDKVGDLAVEIVDMKDHIRVLMDEVASKEVTISAFIGAIKNDQTRVIFRLRFLRCLTWGEVAAVVGGRNTESGVKNMCYRYLESCDDVVRDGA